MLLLVANAVAGCATLSTPLEPPAIRVVALQLLDSNLTQQRFRLTLELTNPNGVQVPIRSMSYQVKLLGDAFANGGLATPFTLPANGTETVDVDVVTDTLATLGSLTRALRASASAIDYEIEGSLQVDLPFVKPLTAAYSGQVPLQMP